MTERLSKELEDKANASAQRMAQMTADFVAKIIDETHKLLLEAVDKEQESDDKTREM